jgi:hypothetical protein
MVDLLIKVACFLKELLFVVSKAVDLYKEVNSTESSPSVRVPCLKARWFIECLHDECCGTI